MIKRAQESIYRTSVKYRQIEESKGIEPDVELQKLRQIQLSRGVQASIAKQARWIDEVSRSYRGDLAIKRSQDCDKKSTENLDRQARYREVSRLLKNSFSRREKHRYECNQACNSTKDPNIISNSSKISLNNKKVKHINPKTHTHTHTHKTSLTNFIFQKISQGSLVSIQ